MAEQAIFVFLKRPIGSVFTFWEFSESTYGRKTESELSEEDGAPICFVHKKKRYRDCGKMDGLIGKYGKILVFGGIETAAGFPIG